tara:strand:- start:41581 stop:42012 length:432 start_codon:yes stop_codon:yes gene_type:complete
MANKATSYDNNQVIVDKIEALRLCISRRHLTLQKKIRAGVRCDTIENVKLTLIAYLLEDYQKNAEDDKDKDCLQLNASEKKGYKLINSFIAYVERECRDCIEARTAFTSGNAGTGSSPVAVNFLVTQDDDPIVTRGGDTLKKL